MIKSPRGPRRATIPAALTNGLSETEIHLMAANVFRLAIPAKSGFFYHVPNQGKRSPQTGQLFKSMGMIPGLTDFVLVAFGPRGNSDSGFLELKRPSVRNHKDGGLSDDQVEFRDFCSEHGLPWGLAYTMEEATTWAREFYVERGLEFRVTL
jgi:hypothetical protein